MKRTESIDTRIPFINERNNPLNIRSNQRNQWKGQVGSSNGFCRFENEIWGYRAAWKLLIQYKKRLQQEGKSYSIRNIIARWAPPSENFTEKYILYVAKKTGVNSEEVLPSPLDNYPLWEKIILNMSFMETGQKNDHAEKEKIRQGLEWVVNPIANIEKHR